MDETIANLVRAFYEANLGVAPWEPALSYLREAMAADACVLARNEVRSGSRRILHAVGLTTDAINTYRDEDEVGDDRLDDAVARGNVSSVFTSDDVNGTATARRNPLAHVLENALGPSQSLYVILEKEPSHHTYIVCCRSETRGRFSAEESDRLGRLAPVLHQAFATGRRQTLERVVGVSTARVLDAIPLGVALLSESGEVVFANKMARSVIGDGDALRLSNGKVMLDQSGHRIRLHELMANIKVAPANGTGGELAALPITRQSGRRPIAMLLVAEPGVEPGGALPAATLFIGDPDRPASFDPVRLARLYGLSQAEGRVAALLAQGHRLEDIAEMLGVAYETVRKHLKQIFSKTGTSRQAELVRVLLSGPAVVPR